MNSRERGKFDLELDEEDRYELTILKKHMEQLRLDFNLDAPIPYCPEPAPSTPPPCEHQLSSRESSFCSSSSSSDDHRESLSDPDNERGEDDDDDDNDDDENSHHDENVRPANSPRDDDNDDNKNSATATATTMPRRATTTAVAHTQTTLHSSSSSLPSVTQSLCQRHATLRERQNWNSTRHPAMMAHIAPVANHTSMVDHRQRRGVIPHHGAPPSSSYFPHYHPRYPQSIRAFGRGFSAGVRDASHARPNAIVGGASADLKIPSSILDNVSPELNAESKTEASAEESISKNNDVNDQVSDLTVRVNVNSSTALISESPPASANPSPLGSPARVQSQPDDEAEALLDDPVSSPNDDVDGDGIGSLIHVTHSSQEAGKEEDDEDVPLPKQVEEGPEIFLPDSLDSGITTKDSPSSIADFIIDAFPSSCSTSSSSSASPPLSDSEDSGSTPLSFGGPEDITRDHEDTDHEDGGYLELAVDDRASDSVSEKVLQSLMGPLVSPSSTMSMYSSGIIDDYRSSVSSSKSVVGTSSSSCSSSSSSSCSSASSSLDCLYFSGSESSSFSSHSHEVCVETRGSKEHEASTDAHDLEDSARRSYPPKQASSPRSAGFQSHANRPQPFQESTKRMDAASFSAPPLSPTNGSSADRHRFHPRSPNFGGIENRPPYVKNPNVGKSGRVTGSTSPVKGSKSNLDGDPVWRSPGHGSSARFYPPRSPGGVKWGNNTNASTNRVSSSVVSTSTSCTGSRTALKDVTNLLEAAAAPELAAQPRPAVCSFTSGYDGTSSSGIVADVHLSSYRQQSPLLPIHLNPALNVVYRTPTQAQYLQQPQEFHQYQHHHHHHHHHSHFQHHHHQPPVHYPFMGPPYISLPLAQPPPPMVQLSQPPHSSLHHHSVNAQQQRAVFQGPPVPMQQQTNAIVVIGPNMTPETRHIYPQPPPPIPLPPSTTPHANHATNQNVQTDKKDRCAFCKSNGEREFVYMSHALRDPESRIVVCPQLRKFVCPICGATGDNAHTQSYCPKNVSNINRTQQSRTVKHLKALRPSAGKMRAAMTKKNP